MEDGSRKSKFFSKNFFKDKNIFTSVIHILRHYSHDGSGRTYDFWIQADASGSETCPVPMLLTDYRRQLQKNGQFIFELPVFLKQQILFDFNFLAGSVGSGIYHNHMYSRREIAKA